MLKSKVIFADMRTSSNRNLFGKLSLLLDVLNLKAQIAKNSLIAIKLHFGERGNTAYIPPIFVRKIVDTVKKYNGKPFITDTCTLYRGDRSEAVSHLILAAEHGFSISVVDAPLIIADGVRGKSEVEIQINKEHFKRVYLAADLCHSDNIIGVAHFKGHELSGFGGALKNIGMGGASRKGKLAQHSTISPQVERKECKGCGQCISICPVSAILLKRKKSFIDHERCIGCAECISICPYEAIKIEWNETSTTFQRKMIEYAYGLLKTKKSRSLFLNFLINISPACDCYGHADAPIVPNIGILGSIDPVAIDQASVDLVNQQRGLENSQLRSNLKKGEDKFKGLYPDVEWGVQLDYAAELGLGTREYHLVDI